MTDDRSPTAGKKSSRHDGPPSRLSIRQIRMVLGRHQVDDGSHDGDGKVPLSGMPILPTVRPDAVLLEEKAAYNRHLKVKVENAPKPSLEEIVNSLKCEIAQKEGYIAGLNYVKGFDGTKQLRLVVDLINSGATTEQIKRWCEVQINKGKP